LLDCRSKRPNGNRGDRRTQEAAIVACVAHLRKRGVLLGRWHVFDQLIELDVAFPTLSFRDFVLACAVASAEGNG
jgi:hypothetical protein